MPIWLLDGAAADQEAAEKLIGRFEDLSVLGIAGDDGEPAGSFTVRDDGGEYQLEFRFEEEEEDYSVSSSRVEGRFEVATYIAEQMLVDADELLPQADEPEADAGPAEAAESVEAETAEAEAAEAESVEAEAADS